jgi:hypothetical protein
MFFLDLVLSYLHHLLNVSSHQKMMYWSTFFRPDSLANNADSHALAHDLSEHLSGKVPESKRQRQQQRQHVPSKAARTLSGTATGSVLCFNALLL